jgi:hypothetical protein
VPPLVLGSEKHLFIDDQLIDALSNPAPGGGEATLADLNVAGSAMRLYNSPGRRLVPDVHDVSLWDSPTPDWHHAAITYDAEHDQHRLFIDGKLQLPLPPPFQMSPLLDSGEDYFSIGCDADGDGSASSESLVTPEIEAKFAEVIGNGDSGAGERNLLASVLAARGRRWREVLVLSFVMGPNTMKTADE